jgi:hypothetical protein
MKQMRVLAVTFAIMTTFLIFGGQTVSAHPLPNSLRMETPNASQDCGPEFPGPYYINGSNGSVRINYNRYDGIRRPNTEFRRIQRLTEWRLNHY